MKERTQSTRLERRRAAGADLRAACAASCFRGPLPPVILATNSVGANKMDSSASQLAPSEEGSVIGVGQCDRPYDTRRRLSFRPANQARSSVRVQNRPVGLNKHRKVRKGPNRASRAALTYLRAAFARSSLCIWFGILPS